MVAVGVTVPTGVEPIMLPEVAVIVLTKEPVVVGTPPVIVPVGSPVGVGVGIDPIELVVRIALRGSRTAKSKCGKALRKGQLPALVGLLPGSPALMPCTTPFDAT